MKNPKKTILLLACTIPVAWTRLHATENKPVTPQPLPRSVFIQPTSTKDGRDPFFPESTRTIAEATAQTNAAAGRTTDATALKVRGISGTPGNMLAIINNHTFAVGDEGEVLTSSGRIRLRCVDIRQDGVSVEIAGRIQHLNLENKK
jgi:hypothetical protein